MPFCSCPGFLDNMNWDICFCGFLESEKIVEKSNVWKIGNSLKKDEELINLLKGI